MGAPGTGDRLVVGRIGRAHGLRGEVAVRFSSNRPERAEPGSVLYAGDRQLVVGERSSNLALVTWTGSVP